MCYDGDTIYTPMCYAVNWYCMEGMCSCVTVLQSRSLLLGYPCLQIHCICKWERQARAQVESGQKATESCHLSLQAVDQRQLF